MESIPQQSKSPSSNLQDGLDKKFVKIPEKPEDSRPATEASQQIQGIGPELSRNLSLNMTESE